EFYTAKDFPIPETDRTDKNDKSSPPFDPLALLKNLFIGSKSKHVKLVSQGYAIETNDMHGKPKAVWVYGEGKTSPLSGTEYIYQTSADKATLDNTVQVIGPDGNIREVMFGVEQDVFVDLREQSSNTYNAGLGINVDVIPALF